MIKYINKYSTLTSIIIALITSFLITIFIYSISNKKSDTLYAYKQNILINPQTFVLHMNIRLQNFISKFDNEFSCT